jgi:gliding motility-associated-like protein
MRSAYITLFALLFSFFKVYAQQDVDLHLTGTFLQGKNILKVKRDYHDPYLWVLAQNNEVYRINSITKVIDDYTSQFSAYAASQFIDIAGRSQDTVFIATNSTNVIEYKKGILKVISVAGTVNSIGIDATGQYNSLIHTNFIALIGTNAGIYRYDYQTESLSPAIANVPGKIYECTYRSEMFNDGDCRCYPDTVTHFGMVENVSYTIFVGEVWLDGNSFGHTLKSAYYTNGGAYTPNTQFTIYSNLIWATENGLFQNYWNYSYSTLPYYPYYHYLKGANITKITSIYGLLSFGGANGKGLIKENLLVGTSQGLYFSNSKYQNGGVPNYTFFYAAELGNKAINDICVNANTYAAKNTGDICEDGIWVGATDGLYLITPNYAPYINTAQKLQAIQFNGQNYGVSQVQICANTTVTAQISAYSGTAVQWYKDGQPVTGATGSSLTITDAGDYYTMLYDPCSPIYFESNHLTVSVLSAPAFSFNYADKISYCDGTTATLKTDNNAAYQYRWYKDGVLNGNTTATLNTNLNGKYKVEVSTCQGGSWVASKEVEIDFIKMPQPIVTADKAAYCAGDQAILTASVSIDASQIQNWAPYQYRWYKDGVLNNITTPSMAAGQAGKYKVEVLSCAGTWVASAETTLSFITLTPPVIVSNKAAYCIGDQAALSVNFVNTGNYTINWYLNGNLLSNNQNQTSLTTSQAGSYTVNIASNLTSCSSQSAAYALSFDTPPTLSIQQIVNTTLCDGQTVNLKAIFPTGNIQWSTGQTTPGIDVTQSGVYTATVTTASGCSTTQSASVQFLNNPVLALADATLCQFTNETITLTAPAGFAKYEWDGQPGQNTFVTGNLGHVVLKVTDNNGCTTTHTITVSSHCKDIYIPNTFTPNGDQQNDTWVITGLDNDNSTNVKIYNRTGTLLFNQTGYSKPWDGTVNGKKLPVGAYYYIISARGARQILSGSVTIIY